MDKRTAAHHLELSSLRHDRYNRRMGYYRLSWEPVSGETNDYAAWRRLDEAAAAEEVRRYVAGARSSGWTIDEPPDFQVNEYGEVVAQALPGRVPVHNDQRRHAI